MTTNEENRVEHLIAAIKQGKTVTLPHLSGSKRLGLCKHAASTGHDRLAVEWDGKRGLMQQPADDNDIAQAEIA